MSDATRRNFLIATGAGAAAAGVAAAIPVSAAANASSSAAQKPLTKPADAEPLVAHISDPDTGEVCLLVGNREVVVHDHDLVARLTRAASPLFSQGV
ncbi:MAG: hypothetical protein QOH56_1074 [Pseudonocardiales bacterium]|jgi:hypothetical protein|nr:hypothetical protein [Pseudonocardiales bacterium]MDQ1734823.1 hypothetical protein [Pseudonocardiales bacterium]